MKHTSKVREAYFKSILEEKQKKIKNKFITKSFHLKPLENVEEKMLS